jgi:transglutaminase-like putative cysteine protease
LFVFARAFAHAFAGAPGTGSFPRIAESRLKRRDFLAASAALALLAAAPADAAPAKKKPAAKKPAAPSKPATPAAEAHNVISLPDEPLAQWRSYDLYSTVSLQRINGKARLWLPLAQYKDTPWERSLGHSWQGNFANAGIYRDPVAEMEVFYADWPDGLAEPQLQITSQVATQDRPFDITRHGAIAERTEVLRRCLQSTRLVPLDGIVRRTAERAVGRIKDPLAMGKAIYEWVVENSSYDPLSKSLGSGDIGTMLASGGLAGKSAEISLLFVGLCRSIGIPARPVFGIRVDASRLFACLGATGELSEAQHCRAEFYAPGYGWIPVNPSDVRKAMREENLASGDSRLSVLKKLLFGFWEMNWVSFNAAQDVSLRGSAGSMLPYLIYPEVETRDGRFNSLDKTQLSYRVSASRLEN